MGELFDAEAITAGERSQRRGTVRFGVGTAGGPQSSVWRLWTSKGDVYVAARSIAGVLKVSLHESGQWRHAYTREYATRRAPPVAQLGDRAVAEWARPPEFAPGWTKAFQVIVPSSEVRAPKRRQAGNTKVTWLPPPGPGTATYFTVLLSSAGRTDGDWPKAEGFEESTRLLSQLPLATGETVWLVAHEQPMSGPQHQQLESGRQALLERMRQAGSTVDWASMDLRGFLTGDAEDGSRFYVDIALPPP